MPPALGQVRFRKVISHVSTGIPMSMSTLPGSWAHGIKSYFFSHLEAHLVLRLRYLTCNALFPRRQCLMEWIFTSQVLTKPW